MEWRELAPEDLHGLRNPLIVDVRSPCEFLQGQLPGAKNIPLLSDDERARVGTIYNEQGDIVARHLALEIIAPKIPVLIDDIVALRDRSQTIVVYCWRGGLRSEAVSSVLSIAGMASYRLTGGYKAWRNMVLRELTQDRYAFEPLVLYGLTGSGKTDLLHELSRQECQILDLEAIACHRGSAFGGIGKGCQPVQKNFEAALWAKLRQIDAVRPVFLEAESRKVGRLSLPDSILKRIQHGPAIFVEASPELRVKRLAGEYLNSCASMEVALHDSLLMLDRIKETIGKNRTEEIRLLALAGNIGEAVRALLEHYYDPLYGKSIKNKQFELTVSSDDMQACARKVQDWAQSFAGGSVRLEPRS